MEEIINYELFISELLKFTYRSLLLFSSQFSCFTSSTKSVLSKPGIVLRNNLLEFCLFWRCCYIMCLSLNNNYYFSRYDFILLYRLVLWWVIKRYVAECWSWISGEIVSTTLCPVSTFWTGVTGPTRSWTKCDSPSSPAEWLCSPLCYPFTLTWNPVGEPLSFCNYSYLHCFTVPTNPEALHIWYSVI